MGERGSHLPSPILLHQDILTMTLTVEQLNQIVDQIAANRNDTPALLNADQASELLNVPASWLLAEARANRVPHCRLGRYVRFSRDELLAWIDTRTTGPRP
jgi:excisionase family DNA binding protein